MLKHSLFSLIPEKELQRFVSNFANAIDLPVRLQDLSDENLSITANKEEFCSYYFTTSPQTIHECILDFKQSIKVCKTTQHYEHKCIHGFHKSIFPVFVENEHVASLLMSPYLREEENYSQELLVKAEKLGFNVKQFEEQLQEVHVLDRERLKVYHENFYSFASLLGALAESNLKTKREIEVRKNKEVQLKKSEKLFRDFVETTDSLVAQVDPEGNVLYLNSRFKEVMGIDPSHIEGLTAFHILRQDGYDRNVKTFNFLKNKKLSKITLQRGIWTKNKELKTYLWTLIYAYDEFKNLKHINCIGRDITAFKSSLDKLQASESKYKNIVEYAYDWELWHAEDGKLIWTNAIVEKFTGYTVDEALALEKFPFHLIHEEDRASVEKLFYKALEDQNTCTNLPFRMNKKDGSTIWVEICWRPIFDNENVFIGLRSSARDITFEKRAEDNIRRVEKRYRNIFNHSFDGIFIFAVAGRILDANTRALSMLNVSLEEVIGKNILDLFSKNSSETAKLALQKTISQGNTSFRGELKISNNQTLKAEIKSCSVDKEHRIYQLVVHSLENEKTCLQSDHRKKNIYDKFTEIQ